MITYADIKRIYRLEKRDASLQDIGSGFYSEVNELLKSEEKHREAFVKLIEDIYNSREQKIILWAIRAQRADVGALENLTPEEKEMYGEVWGVLKKYRGRSLEKEKPAEEKEKERDMEGEEVAGGEIVGEKEKIMGGKITNGKIKIMLIQSLPAIICSDLRHYGPFSKGDIVEIPAWNAKILIRHGMAKEV